MSADYNGIGSRHPAQPLKEGGGGLAELQKRQDWQKHSFCIAVAASLATVLSILQAVSFQSLPLQSSALATAVAVVGSAGICAGVFSYSATRAVAFLAGYDLLEVLTGAEPISIRWLYLLALGVIIGGGVASFTGLAVVLLLPPVSH